MLRRALENQFLRRGLQYDVYEASGAEDLSCLVRSVGAGYDVCVAAGGDGTVSAVAHALVELQVPLGIIPIGTANTLARELGIPLAVDKACALIAGEHGLLRIDAMLVAGRYRVLNVSAGFTALTMRDTTGESKRRLGTAAYIWTGLRALAGSQPVRFRLQVDGRPLSLGGSDVLVVNGTTPVQSFVRPGYSHRLDDGELGVYVLRCRTIGDYLVSALRLLQDGRARDPRVRFFPARQKVHIASEPAVPVQADGDYIGQTPVEVTLVPKAVSVIVPLRAAAGP
jgi:diacylglycerol kinase family enzyme